ncbi:hypothetical protein D1AOALGA4SA_11725 [Olavius algarvensis Delta 1 endosymbiont]|nr:hypothetical protein D1AOALGA4SA_11725 [Olavius algarvensis Delta 1 endosymbiont]
MVMLEKIDPEHAFVFEGLLSACLPESCAEKIYTTIFLSSP